MWGPKVASESNARRKGASGGRGARGVWSAQRRAGGGPGPLRADGMYQNKPAGTHWPRAARDPQLVPAPFCRPRLSVSVGAAAAGSGAVPASPRRRPRPRPSARALARAPGLGAALPGASGLVPPRMAHSPAAAPGAQEPGCPIRVEHDRRRRQFTVRLNGNACPAVPPFVCEGRTRGSHAPQRGPGPRPGVGVASARRGATSGAEVPPGAPDAAGAAAPGRVGAWPTPGGAGRAVGRGASPRDSPAGRAASPREGGSPSGSPAAGPCLGPGNAHLLGPGCLPVSPAAAV